MARLQAWSFRDYVNAKVPVKAFAHKAEDEPMIRNMGITEIVVGEFAEAAVVAKAVKGVIRRPAALEMEWSLESSSSRPPATPRCSEWCFVR